MPDLFEQIYEVTPRRESKAEIVEYYQQEHPRNWQASLVHDLHPFTNVKNEHNLARRFNPDRINNPGRKSEQSEYREFGLTLPPKLPEGAGFHIEGTVWMKFSDGDCEEREVDETIVGDEAQALARMASFDMQDALVRHYMEDALYDEPSARIGGCEPPDLVVELIET